MEVIAPSQSKKFLFSQGEELKLLQTKKESIFEFFVDM